MEITPLGDSALILHMGDQRQDASEQTVNQVLGVMYRIERAQLPGIIELAPAYTTLAVYFDPGRVIDGGADPDGVVDWLTKKLNDALGKSRRLRRDKLWNGTGRGIFLLAWARSIRAAAPEH